MNSNEIEHVIESILFASGEPVSTDVLSVTLSLRKDEVKLYLKQLSDRLEDEQRGVRVIRVENAWQMITAPEYGDIVSLALQKKKKPALSNAALEVLAIIAYQQPVTRSYIEQVRGIDSSAIVSNLEEKGYIEEQGRLDAPGRPIIFGTSKEFLRVFGLPAVSDLPKIDTEHMDELTLESVIEEQQKQELDGENKTVEE